MNRIILTGRLIKDVELKYTKNDKEYTRFTLAVQRDVKNQLGEYETDFINCVSYSHIAKLMSEYLIKGDKIGIEGRLVTGSYEKDGQKIYTSEVVTDKIEFMTPKKSNAEKENKKIEEKIEKSEEVDLFEEFGKEIADEDLPF